MKSAMKSVLKRVIATTVAGMFAGYSTQAANVAIINGMSLTTETGTTADITSNLQALETAAGNTTTVFDTTPSSLAGYAQVWDIRFFDAAALAPAVVTQYVNFLQAGHTMFVMGENTAGGPFLVRDNSLLNLVSTAGGGNLTLLNEAFNVQNNTQTVNSAFSSGIVGPLVYNNSGRVANSGTGQFMTFSASNGGGGSGVVWSPGTLANATPGALTMVLDVNFMQAGASANETQFLKNLIGYVTSPTPVGPIAGNSTPTQKPQVVIVVNNPNAPTVAQLLIAPQMNTVQALTSITMSDTANALQQSNSMQRRNEAIRSGSSGFSPAGLAVNGDGPSYNGAIAFRTGVAGPNGSINDVIRGDGKMTKEVKEVTPAEERWGTFLTGTGEWVSVGDNNNARGYDLTNGGFLLGVDYKLTPHFAVGLAAGYTGSVNHLTEAGRIWENSGKLGLYATAFAGGWYADVSAFGGYSGYDTRRSALLGTARGDTHGGEFDGLVGTGYDFKKGAFTFGPTASFNYTYLGIRGYTEHGSLAPLDISGSDTESERLAIGFKASFDWKVGSVLVKPEVRAAWQHEFGATTSTLSATLADFPAGGGFTAEGPSIGRDSALIGAGFSVQLTERCNTYVYYDGELGRHNYQSTAVSGGVRITF